jgi:hypothetical protein
MVFVEMEIMALTESEMFAILRDSGRYESEYIFTKFAMRSEVQTWSETNSIRIKYEGTLYGVYDVWNIPDNQHRMWFRLRWQ